MAKSIFPGKNDDAESTYQNLVSRGKEHRAAYRAKWNHTYAYLKGMRNFKSINFKDGTVKASYVDGSGHLRFVYGQVLTNFICQYGRLLGMDLTPRVTRKSESLEGQRRAAIAQSTLADLFPAASLDLLKRDIIPPLLCYGNLGLSLWQDKRDKHAMAIQTIVPWEVLPIPTSVAVASEARGMIVRRKWSIEDVREQFGKSDEARRGVLANVATQSVARGDMPASITDDGSAGSTDMDAFFSQNFNYSTAGGSTKKGSDKGQTDQMAVAWLGLVYLWDEQRYLTEQLIFVEGQAGSKLLARVPFEDTRNCSTVTMIRDIDTGGYFAESWIANQIPLNQEIEACTAKAFQNQQDLNIYGTTLIPTTYGLTRQALLPARDGVKIQPYEMDGMTPARENVVQLQPFNTGLLPVRTVDMGVGLMDKMAAQPAAMSRGDAPGRIDSASALGVLLEASNVPISPVAASIAGGVVDMYRAALCKALHDFDMTDTIAITMLTDALAGVVYDPKTGTISVGQNAIPHPEEVAITVNSMLPTSRQQQILELKDELTRLNITPRQYRIKSRLMGLELPVCNEVEWENYKKARLENVLLFHDGQTVPEGTEEEVGVLFSADADMHDVHIMVHSELVATTQFAMAKPPVRTRVLNHLLLHKDSSGALPEGMPPMEEAAMENLQPGMGQMQPEMAQMQPQMA
jgi:hypothetical protein